jgi:hypothetical protein
MRHVVEVEANSTEEAEAEALALDDYGPGSWVCGEDTGFEVYSIEESGRGEQ